ncbi:MAG: hypothetical protein IKP04_00460 [Candidatus Methanomethylophilaceae archaeon]|nr:hypothetical protein [Candidatus Methanomethylophilaceae archaeon]
MTTNDDLERFVAQNKELVESMMKVPKDTIKAAAMASYEGVRMTNEFAKAKGQEAFDKIHSTLVSPDIQKHFIAAGLEFMEGMKALLQHAPVPGFAKEAAEDMEKSTRQVICACNPNCPMKKTSKKKAE